MSKPDEKIFAEIFQNYTKPFILNSFFNQIFIHRARFSAIKYDEQQFKSLITNYLNSVQIKLINIKSSLFGIHNILIIKYKIIECIGLSGLNGILY